MHFIKLHSQGGEVIYLNLDNMLAFAPSYLSGPDGPVLGTMVTFVNGANTHVTETPEDVERGVETFWLPELAKE